MLVKWLVYMNGNSIVYQLFGYFRSGQRIPFWHDTLLLFDKSYFGAQSPINRSEFDADITGAYNKEVGWDSFVLEELIAIQDNR